MSTESELERLRKELRGEQKRGFDVKEGVLNLISGFSEAVPLSDTLTTLQPGDAKHPRLSESLSISEGNRALQQASGTFLVDTARVGMSDLS